MPVRSLPERPSLEHLRYQARDLLRNHAERDRAVAQRIREFHPRWTNATDAAIFDAKFSLSDAQLTIAREYGYTNWTRLKRRVVQPRLQDQVTLPHHQRIEDPVFRRGVELIDAGDKQGLQAHLRNYPALLRQRVIFEGGNYFRNPALIEFIAENPVRHGKLPKNIVEIAEVILDAGVGQSSLNETLMLVATGSVPRECGVQSALIDVLCDHGAVPDSAIEAAAVLFEMPAVDELLRRGAHLTLPVAAALGRVDQVQRLLPNASADKRHLALAMGAQYGHTEILRLLLDAGEDPNRFNPPGGHSHSTPLHQAAGNGHLEAVKLLVERGAQIQTKDILFGATPAGWASYAGKTGVEAYLRGLEKNMPEAG